VLWQPEYYHHLIRDEHDFRMKMRYVLDNPAKAGLDEWPCVGPEGDSTARPPE
jgi:menaquinone-specific isochorismate synthase